MYSTYAESCKTGQRSVILNFCNLTDMCINLDVSVFHEGIIIFLVHVLLYSTLLHLPPLRFHFFGELNPELLRLWHWNSDALTTHKNY